MQDFFTLLDDAHPLLLPAFIVLAKTTDVALGTLRTLFVVRGHRLIAAMLGFVEVIVWVLAASGVLEELSAARVIAYGLGFAMGNAVGIWIEQKLAIGQQVVTLISRHRTKAVALALRLADYLVTELPAKGGRGDVSMCLAVVPRSQTPEVMRIARGIDESIFATIEEVRTHNALPRRPRRTLMPTGWRAVLKKK
ncbi:MAG: DUF2179 domain-containing protein [Phycisphaeraceae bacterium]